MSEDKEFRKKVETETYNTIQNVFIELWCKFRMLRNHSKMTEFIKGFKDGCLETAQDCEIWELEQIKKVDKVKEEETKTY